MATVVKLDRLVCLDTEDTFGSDEAFLRYNGELVFGPRKIKEGQSRDINVTRPIDVRALVQLFDDDSPDGNDHLGTIEILRGEVGAGQRSVGFTGDGANYLLFYRVVNDVQGWMCLHGRVML